MRIPGVDPHTAAAEVRETLEGLPDLGLFRVVAHAETAFGPWLAYGGVLLTALELAPRLRELAILQVASQEDSEYEWAQHVEIAVRLGMDAVQIEAVERQELSGEAFNEHEALVLRATEEAGSEGAVTAATVEALTEAIGVRGAVELLLVIGHYTAIARLIASFAVPRDAPARLDAADAGQEAA